MENGKNKYSVALDASTYTKDVTGKGVIIPSPTSSPGDASANQKSLSPGSKHTDPSPTGGSKGTPKKEASADSNKKTLKPSEESDVKEHLEVIFDGEELSEETKEKIATVFQVAIDERVKQIVSELTEQASQALETEIEKVTTELSEKVDDYLNYVVEEWVKDNQLAVETGIRVDIAESFLEGLKELFETHYISIPEGKLDVVESLTAANDKLEKDLNEEIEKTKSLNRELIEHKAAIIFFEVSDGLADTEIERFASLVESIDFENEDQYKRKLLTIKDSYFKESHNAIEESTSDSASKTMINEGMERYLSTLNRNIKNNK